MDRRYARLGNALVHVAERSGMPPVPWSGVADLRTVIALRRCVLAFAR
jgi:hypothetical protein